MIRGAIFDLDGVLLDSMGIWEDLGARYLQRLHITPEPGLNEVLFPMSMEQGAVYLGAYRKDVDTVNTRMIWYHRKDDSFKEWKASDGSLLPTYIGMPVIFVKNTDQFANGTRGTIVEVGENSVSVQVDSKIIQVYKERIRDGEKTISQLPIRPAYAMTIHKGQGLTMSKVILNPKCFAPGQLYTALSRVRRIEDLVLTQKIRPQDVIASPEVIDFMKQVG